MRFHVKQLFFLCINSIVVSCYLQTSQNKVCEFSEQSPMPYSGFKINRNYEVRCSAPPVLHYVTLSHCDQGNLEYERITRTGRETDIDWSQAACLITPPEMRKRLANKERRESRETFKFSKLKPSNEDSLSKSILKTIPKLPHTVKIFTKSLPEMAHKSILEKRSKSYACGQQWRGFLMYLSGRLGYAEYHSQDVLNTSVDELTPINYNELNDEDAENVVCYKFARRKRYALRESTIFAPFTWVGGIFQCDVTDDDKLRYLRHVQDAGSHRPFNIICDETNATPVGPLIAERLDHQWRIREGFSKSSLRVPYLYTPGLLDFRFGASGEILGLRKSSVIYKGHISKDSTDDINYDSWWKEINVNENYNYTKRDIDLITRTTSKTVSLVNQFVERAPKKMFSDWDLGIPELNGPDNSSISYLEQQLFHLFSKSKNPETLTNFTTQIQRYWDDIRLSIG